MKKITTIVMLVFLTGCATNTTTVGENREPIVINEDPILREIQKPSFALPSDIHEKQIQKYFEYHSSFGEGGNKYFALVLGSSRNIDLSDVPKEFPITFLGILTANEGEKAWKKMLEIKNLGQGQNNPYYLWTIRDDLFLSVVDDLGGGSGEGYMKLFIREPIADSTGKTKFTGKYEWHLSGCFYFGLHSTMGSSFEDSKNLNLHWPQAIEYCQNDVQIIQYPL